MPVRAFSSPEELTQFVNDQLIGKESVRKISSAGGLWFLSYSDVLDLGVRLFISSSGQSNSIGSGGAPALSLTQTDDNLQVEGGAHVDCVEDTVESHKSAMVNWLSGNETNRKSIAHTWGVGGAVFTTLKKGTAPYIAGQAALALSKGLLPTDRPSEIWRHAALVWIHGETDEIYDLPAATYQGYLDELQADWEADTQAALLIENDIYLFVTQQGAWTQLPTNPKQRSEIAVVQYEASRDNPKIVFVGPLYPFDYNSGDVHLINTAHHRNGEYIARAIHRVIIEKNTDWNGLGPDSIVAVNNVITLTAHGGDGSNLRIDTTHMFRRPFYGFEYWDDSDHVPGIVDVQVSGRTVQVTLDRNASATGRLRYAYTASVESEAGAGLNLTGPGGNIRDQEETPSIYPGAANLYNWMAVFDKLVDSYIGGGASALPVHSNWLGYTLDGEFDHFNARYTGAFDGITDGTWSIWFRRFDRIPGNDESLWCANRTGGRSFELRIRSNGAIRLYFSPDGTSISYWDSAASVYTYDDLYHLVVVKAGTSLTVYLNQLTVNDITAGGSWVSGSMPATLPSSYGSSMQFGAAGNATGAFFGPGHLLQPAFFNFALTPTQVETLNGQGTIPDHRALGFANPRHWYPLQGNLIDLGDAETRNIYPYGQPTSDWMKMWSLSFNGTNHLSGDNPAAYLAETDALVIMVRFKATTWPSSDKGIYSYGYGLARGIDLRFKSTGFALTLASAKTASGGLWTTSKEINGFAANAWDTAIWVWYGPGATDADKMQMYRGSLLLTNIYYAGVIPSQLTPDWGNDQFLGSLNGGSPFPDGFISEFAIWSGENAKGPGGTPVPVGWIDEINNNEKSWDLEQSNLGKPQFWYRGGDESGSTLPTAIKNHGTAGATYDMLFLDGMSVSDVVGDVPGLDVTDPEIIEDSRTVAGCTVCYNAFPTLIKDSDTGLLLTAYYKGKTHGSFSFPVSILTRKSTDGGASWSDPVTVDTEPAGPQLLNNCRIGPKMPDGNWPLAYHSQELTRVPYRQTHMALSDDDGDSWTLNGRARVYPWEPTSAVILDDGGSMVDYTTEANEDTANDVPLLPSVVAVDDAIYFALDEYYTLRLLVNVTTAGVGDWAVTWEYYSSSGWAALSNVSDGTNAFKTSGENKVTWDDPGDFAEVSVNGQGAFFYVRARVTTGDASPTARPWAGRVWMSFPDDRRVTPGNLVIDKNGTHLLMTVYSAMEVQPEPGVRYIAHLLETPLPYSLGNEWKQRGLIHKPILFSTAGSEPEEPHMEYLSDGTLYCLVRDDLSGTVYYDPPEYGGTQREGWTYFTRSTDNGKTWSPIAFAFSGCGLPSFVEIPTAPGTLIAVSRNKTMVGVDGWRGRPSWHKSTDYGETWTTGVDFGREEYGPHMYGQPQVHLGDLVNIVWSQENNFDAGNRASIFRTLLDTG